MRILLVLAALAAGPAAAWTAAEAGQIASLSLSRLPAPPADPTNAFERDPRAAALGRQLFFDTRLSANGKISCATCHDPARQFQDGRRQGVGIGLARRRTQPIAQALHGPWFFWDGRRDSLWAQALVPLEDPDEHGSSRGEVASIVQARYRAAYEAVFGPPGDATRVFANVGKALAAYQKTLRLGPARFDRYADSVARGREDASLLTPEERRGLAIFIGRGQCVSCHNGPLFTDHFFHSTRVPPLDAKAPDPGRAEGSRLALAAEFNCRSAYSDARSPCAELDFIDNVDPVLARAFKTPSLRGVATRPPYMHAGQFGSLESVIAHYIAAPESVPLPPPRPGAPRAHRTGSELVPLTLDLAEQAALIAFLRTLDSPVIDPAVR